MSANDNHQKLSPDFLLKLKISTSNCIVLSATNNNFDEW